LTQRADLTAKNLEKEQAARKNGRFRYQQKTYIPEVAVRALEKDLEYSEN